MPIRNQAFFRPLRPTGKRALYPALTPLFRAMRLKNDAPIRQRMLLLRQSLH